MQVFCPYLITFVTLMKILYGNLSDNDLISLLKQGNEFAFNEIFKRYQVLLFSITYRRLNDIEVSKDLIHDMFANLWEKRAVLNVPGDFQAFLITVLKNRILNHFKHQQVSQRYLHNFHKYLEKNDNSTDHLIRHNDLSQIIELEIAALPEKMRIVFELSRKSELSRREIAGKLNISEETVKSRMRNAMIILKDKLGVLIVFVMI